MRAIVPLIATVAVVSAAQAGPEQPARSTEHATATLKVSGMRCSACAATVERTARRMPGVVAATASQPKGLVEVRYDPAATAAEEIAKFLSKHSGFKAEAPKSSK